MTLVLGSHSEAGRAVCAALAARGVDARPRVAQTGRPLTLAARDPGVSHSAAYACLGMDTFIPHTVRPGRARRVAKFSIRFGSHDRPRD